MIGYTVLILVILIALGIAMFINISPQFGGKASKEQVEVYKTSQNYKKGKFINERDAILK